MKRKYLIILNVFYFISILLIFVFGPFYSNYSREDLETYEKNPVVQSRNLDFSSQQEYELLSPTFLDWYSIVEINFTSTQPIYVLITESSPLPLYEKSTFGNEYGTLTYFIVEPAYYTVLVKGFDGTAHVIVTINLSMVTRDKPYALWGQVMYYGGIGLLIASVALIVITLSRKERPPPKQLQKAVTPKKTEKGR